MRNLSADGVGDFDIGVIEQKAGGAVEFKLSFLVGRFGGDESDLSRGQARLILEHGGGSGSAERVLLLLGIERLARQITRSLGGSDTGSVLLHSKLRVADFDAHLVFDLLDAELGLTVFELGAHLGCLRGAVADGDVDRDACALVGSCGINELVQGAAVTCGRSNAG